MQTDLLFKELSFDNEKYSRRKRETGQYHQIKFGDPIPQELNAAAKKAWEATARTGTSNYYLIHLNILKVIYFINQSIYSYIYLSNLSVYLSINLFIYLSIHLSICLSFYPSICLSI